MQNSVSSTTPETVTVEEAEKRLNELIEKFEGKFFTVNGTYCAASGIHAVECSNCRMSNVIATEWVTELVGMGNLTASLCPTQYNFNGSQWSSDGWQCFGFANFAHWYIFAGKNTDKIVSTLELTGPLTYETISKALPGDVLRSNYYGGHSMVFISCDENGFTVIDSNYTSNSTGNAACQVKVHTIKYNEKYSVAITGVQNYDREINAECKHQYAEEVTAPTCTEQGYTTYTCECGESYVDDYVEATGHSFGEWYETKAPTVKEEGEERRDCKNCDHYEARVTEKFKCLYGDVDLDGKINVIDANLVRKAATKIATLDENQKFAADVNGDGKINVIDASLVRKFAAKLITKFPVEE